MPDIFDPTIAVNFQVKYTIIVPNQCHSEAHWLG